MKAGVCSPQNSTKSFFFLEIGNEHFDRNAFAMFLYHFNAFGEVRSALVQQIIAVYACNHDVIQPPLAYCRSDFPRFENVERSAFDSFPDAAEMASARAHASEDHERRSASAPAFAGVGAVRLFADGY